MIVINKRGADKMISVYWFVIITIIAGGIVLMVNAYYGKPYDVREIEADILAQKVAHCMYFGGEVNEKLMAVNGAFKQEFGDNLGENCNLNFETLDEFTEEQYYVSVEIYEDRDLDKIFMKFDEGNANYLPDCNIDDGGKKISVCKEKEFWMGSTGSKAYLVKILSIVSKTDENA